MVVCARYKGDTSMSSLQGGPEAHDEPWGQQAWLYKHCLKKVTEGGGERAIAACNVECVILFIWHCARSPSLGASNSM